MEEGTRVAGVSGGFLGKKGALGFLTTQVLVGQGVILPQKLAGALDQRARMFFKNMD